jgi:hypothetical protein
MKLNGNHLVKKGRGYSDTLIKDGRPPLFSHGGNLQISRGHRYLSLPVC